MRRFVVPAVVGLLALAGCGSSHPSAGAGTPSPAGSTGPGASPSASGSFTVTTESSPFGVILATGSGRTLYLLTADTPQHSACSGACASAWPPLTVTSTPSFGPRLQIALFGQVIRPDGSHQLTYGGHPLYTYAGDSGPGQTNGQGIRSFGGLWTVISNTGASLSAPGSGATSASPGGGGYGGGGY